MQLLMSIMEDPYYDSLRTKQQLGYLVFSGVKLVEGVSLMYLLVQSADRDPAYITDRSLEFLEGFRQELVDLPISKLRCGDPATAFFGVRLFTHITHPEDLCAHIRRICMFVCMANQLHTRLNFRVMTTRFARARVTAAPLRVYVWTSSFLSCRPCYS